MATRYWVGGTGTWSTTNTANWSATSGGGSGASVPGPTDDVIFDANSSAASYTVTRNTGLANIASITISAPATGSLTISGNSPTVFIVQGNGTFNHMPSGGTIYFGGTGSANIFVNDTNNSAIVIGLTGNKTYNFSGSAPNYPEVAFAASSTATAVFSTNPVLSGITVATGVSATINLSGSASKVRVLAPTGGSGGLTNNGTLNFTGNAFSGLYWGSTSGSGSGSALTINPGTITPSNYTFYIDQISTRTNNLTLSGTYPNLQILSIGSTSVVGGTATIGNSFVIAPGVPDNRHTIALTCTGSTNQDISCNGNSVGSVNLSSKTGGTVTISTDLTLTATGTCWNTGGAPILVAGSGVITIDSAASTVSRTFAGGGKTYGGLKLAGSATNTTTITGINTFGSMTNLKTAASTLILGAGTTTTITGSFDMSGSAGKLLSLISSVAGTQATLSKSSGAVNVSFMSIKDSAATGGATWTAVSSTDAGNNTGWVFGTGGGGRFLLFF